MVTLSQVCREQFGWSGLQWDAFVSLGEADLMGFEPAEREIFHLEYEDAEQALEALSEVMQRRVVRMGEDNPFGGAKERFDIKPGEYTPRHSAVAEVLKILGVHRTKTPEISSDKARGSVDVVFVLGSTVPSMNNRLIFGRDKVLPEFVGQARPPIVMLLSGNRPLITATRDPLRGLLGDISDETSATGRFLTTAEASSLPEKYYLHGQPTEAGAIELLAREVLAGSEWLSSLVVVDAKGKPETPEVFVDGVKKLKRPDTEDTAYSAGLELFSRCVPVHAKFKVAIVTDAAFPAQKEQVMAGLCRAGIRLDPEQVLFYGSGYPDEILDGSPAYVQIAVSALAEFTYQLLQHVKAEKKYEADCARHKGFHPVAGAFYFASEGCSRMELMAVETKEASKEASL